MRRMLEAFKGFCQGPPCFMTVIGTPGSGKTNLARAMAEKHNFHVQVWQLDRVVNQTNVEDFKRGLAPNLDACGSKVLVIVRTAELISEACIPMDSILIACWGVG
jgi:replication-associated recombination protein RarA